MSEIHCDIVVPVYNNLTYVKDCLESIVSCTGDCPYTLYVMDDGSESRVRDYLGRFAEGMENVRLYLNEENLGFVKNCNRGMRLGSAKYVVLVNSDVVVTPGWLSRMVAHAERDERIASVNPFTNYAAQINIPMPPGASFYAMDEFLRARPASEAVDVVTGVGFCILLRRAALDKVGYFDEVYGAGYCEESDLCMRLTTSGYRTVVSGDVYVYHKGRATFPDRDERYKKNRGIFDERWDDEYNRQFKKFKKSGNIERYRELFLPFYPQIKVGGWERMREALKKTPLRKAVQVVRGRLIRPLLRALSAERAESAFQGGLSCIHRETYARRTVGGPGTGGFSPLSRTGRPSVTYVTIGLGLCGGVISVVQLVNELNRLGMEARIAVLRDYDELENWRFYSRPIVYGTVEEMERNFPPSDIVVATQWKTAYWVDKIAGARPGTIPVYFLQDYESWFYPAEQEELRRKVLATYGMIPNRIVKTDWLSGKLAEDGYNTMKISLGMDLGVFYPRDVLKKGHPVALAMARPSTPRRGFDNVVKSMGLLKWMVPDVEVVFYGEENLSTYGIPYEFTDLGKVVSQEELARLYSGADVYLDGSDFQAFGRPALEAMACGTPVVLTNVGGVNEYARHGANCLAVPPRDPEAAAEAMSSILKDDSLRDKLVKSGLETSERFCHRREAAETKDYLDGLLRANAEKPVPCYPESRLAHRYCTGRGLEIGGAAHNPFGLDTLNIDFTASMDTVFKKHEVKRCGAALKVDVVANGDELPFKDNSVDFIVSSHVFEHFPNPIKALVEWDRVVRPDGVIFIVVPHRDRTFDRGRKRTRLSHLIEDFEKNETENVEDSHGHHHVWITDDLVELAGYMIKGMGMNWELAEAQDVDDKVGNGFAVVIKKRRGG